MAENRLRTGLLLIPLLLMSWGSLRNLITPLGYWMAWGGWACAALAIFGRDGIRHFVPGLARWVIGAFGLLILGAVISGWVNGDSATLHQALKILVIGLMMVAMWSVAARSDIDVLMRTLYVALVLVLLVFFLSRFLFGVSYDIGTRRGDVFASPGVLWASGLYFLPVTLADGLSVPHRWRLAACAVGACLFLTVVDGSRTGLLLIVATFVAMAGILWIRRDWGLVRSRPWMLPLAVVVFLFLLVVDSGVGALRASRVALPGVGASPSSRVEALMDSAVAPVVDNRLGQGDQPRIRLLRSGLDKSRECFPVGCGFGSTAIDAGYGILQYVHNGYLAALADFGLLGFLGMVGFIGVAVVPLWGVVNRAVPMRLAYFRAGMSGSALAYCAALMLNAFSSEMSEWGYLILTLAFAWRAEREP